jgi:membrane-associated phospholipid phosphatase
VPHLDTDQIDLGKLYNALKPSKFLTGPPIPAKLGSNFRGLIKVHLYMKRFLWLPLCLIVIGLFAFYLDQPVSQWFDESTHDSWRVFALQITDVGKGAQWFLLAILVFFISKSRGSEKLANWAAHLFCALIVSGALLHVVKFSFGRQRPHISPDRAPLSFHPLNANWDYQSFPSGHTQTLFCVAIFFSMLWPRKRFLFYSIAVAFAFTRVMALQHFVSDIVGGAIVGIIGTQLSIWIMSRWIPSPRPLSPDPLKPNKQF